MFGARLVWVVKHGDRRWKPGRGVLLVTVLAFGLGLAACSSSTSPTSASTPRQEPLATAVSEQAQIPARGEQLYAANCQVCHGDREGTGGTGGAPSHNETGHTWHHPDAQLKDWILNGKLGFSQMPAFKDVMSEGQVEAALTYIKTWWTPDQRESQSDVSRRYDEALEKQGQDQ